MNEICPNGAVFPPWKTTDPLLLSEASRRMLSKVDPSRAISTQL